MALKFSAIFFATRQNKNLFQIVINKDLA